MKNKLYVLICLSLSLMFIFSFFNSSKITYALPEIVSSAKTMVLIEQNSKRVLLEKYKDTQLPMASTTKIMTALSVLKRCENLDVEIKVDKRAVGIEGTSMYLQKDEVVSLKDLLYGMLLASGNDAACALALHISASIDDFALIMNADAKEIGALNSNFTNPHGLDEQGHFTTAFDLALICSQAMKYPFFKQAISMKSAIVKGAGGKHGDTRLLVNKNKLLGHYEHCTGGKIGFTDNAGRCLVSTATKGNLNLICVVLNCPDMFLDSIKILDFGINNYRQTELLEQYQVHRKIIVEEGKESEVKVYTKRSFCYPLTLDETMEIGFEYELPNTIKAPIEKEQVVGTYKILLNDEIIFEENLYSLEDIKSITFGENFKEIVHNW